MIDTSLGSSNFYFLLAVVQGFILSLIILFQKPQRKAHLFFGILIALFSSSLLHLILEESIHAFNSKYPIPMEFSFAYGPLAYLHVLYIKNPMKAFNRKDLLHFLPSLLLDILFFIAFFLYIRFNMGWAYENIPKIQTIALIMASIGLIHLSVYAFLIYRESKDAQPVLREFARIKKWLKYLVFSWCSIIGFLLVAIPIALLYIDQLDDNSAYIYKPLGTLIGLCIYGLGYLYLLYYLRPVNSYIDRIKKFRFSDSGAGEKKEQILQALKEEKLYEDPALTVSKLAGHLNWPINKLSGMINEIWHTNFNDLTNQLRVEAFKEKMLQPENRKYSIVGLGQEVGFRSKASFYRAFKKETGMTPSDYLKAQTQRA